MINVEEIDCSSEIFGCHTSFPLGFAPAAMHSLAHEDGEVATSRAAAKFGVCMALSMYATASIEDVTAQARHNPYVVHLGGLRDRGNAKQLLRRAEGMFAYLQQGKLSPTIVDIIYLVVPETGCKAVFLSVDTPQIGRRLNEQRNHFAPPRGTSWPNVVPTGTNGTRLADDPGEAPGTRDLDPSLSWERTIPWLRQHTKLQLWIKGICTAEDVELAIKHGVDGIIVSNHGGRQLDSVPSTLDMLRECTIAAENKIPVAVDGGIRRGTDIFKAIAMGAQHCFVGRVPIWGLAVSSHLRHVTETLRAVLPLRNMKLKTYQYNGQEGVELALDILFNEFRLAMALAG